MYCIVSLVLADSLICCVNPIQVIVIGRSLPANVVSEATYDTSDFYTPYLSRLLCCATLLQALSAALTTNQQET